MIAIFQTRTVSYQEIPPVIPSRRFGRVIRDADMSWRPDEVDNWPNGVSGVSRPTRNHNSPNVDRALGGGLIGTGLPATGRSEGDIDLPMTEDLQRFVFERACDLAGMIYKYPYIDTRYTDPKAKSDIASFFRGNSYAFDRAGSGTHHDYINGTNEDADDIRNIAMLTADAEIEIKGDQIVNKKDCWVIRAINILKEDPWKYTIKDRGLSYVPQNSRRVRIMNGDNWTGKYEEWHVNAFHMFKGKVRMWNFSTLDYLFIPKRRVKLL